MPSEARERWHDRLVLVLLIACKALVALAAMTTSLLVGLVAVVVYLTVMLAERPLRRRIDHERDRGT